MSARSQLCGVRLLAFGALVCLAACGSSGSGPGPASGGPVPSTDGPTQVQDYRLLMDAYAAESGLSSVIDPMTFVTAPGASASVGPLTISHVDGVAPADRADSPASPLLGADGRPLGISLGQWEKAAGTVTFRCVGSHRQATSNLTGLIPEGRYSAFAVHVSLDGPGRFTPWGDPAGTTNNFTASATGTASPVNSLDGCSGTADDIIIIWHSDGVTHGKSPGAMGVNWHTSLISSVP